jgi:hypothetical protein
MDDKRTLRCIGSNDEKVLKTPSFLQVLRIFRAAFVGRRLLTVDVPSVSHPSTLFLKMPPVNQ